MNKYSFDTDVKSGIRMVFFNPALFTMTKNTATFTPALIMN